MTEKAYTPKFPLNQFVNFIWIGKEQSINLKLSHHAALFTELIFNYGDQFQVNGQNIANFAGHSGHHIISGLKTEPFQTKVFGAYNNIGLILKPFCYGMLIRKFGTKEMNTISNILYENLFEPETPQFELIEPPLLKLFDDMNTDTDLQKFETHISSKLLQKGSLKKFNHSLSISQKSFIHKFKNHYTLTPSQYVKLKQVNYAIYLLNNSKSGNLTQVGLEAGFYDQSHFIKVFKKFCGVTPKQFILNRKGKFCTISSDFF